MSHGCESRFREQTLLIGFAYQFETLRLLFSDSYLGRRLPCETIQNIIRSDTETGRFFERFGAFTLTGKPESESCLWRVLVDRFQFPSPNCLECCSDLGIDVPYQTLPKTIWTPLVHAMNV